MKKDEKKIGILCISEMIIYGSADNGLIQCVLKGKGKAIPVTSRGGS
jgi:hypothetical protein